MILDVLFGYTRAADLVFSLDDFRRCKAKVSRNASGAMMDLIDIDAVLEFGKVLSIVRRAENFWEPEGKNEHWWCWCQIRG